MCSAARFESHRCNGSAFFAASRIFSDPFSSVQTCRRSQETAEKWTIWSDAIIARGSALVVG